MPIRIGFVDYKLDNFHANVFLKAIRGPLKDRGGSVAGCFAVACDRTSHGATVLVRHRHGRG